MKFIYDCNAKTTNSHFWRFSKALLDKALIISLHLLSFFQRVCCKKYDYEKIITKGNSSSFSFHLFAKPWTDLWYYNESEHSNLNKNSSLATERVLNYYSIFHYLLENLFLLKRTAFFFVKLLKYCNTLKVFLCKIKEICSYYLILV